MCRCRFRFGGEGESAPSSSPGTVGLFFRFFRRSGQPFRFRLSETRDFPVVFRPVEREVLDTVLREALAAPSSRNSHSTHLRVVTDPETIARIARMRDYGSAFLEHAPAVVLVEGDRTATDLWRENAAITATALLFAATDAGLASCWVHVNGRPCLKDQPDGAQAEDYLREFLPVPAEHGILCAVALGYSDFEPAALPPFDAGTHIHWPEK